MRRVMFADALAGLEHKAQDSSGVGDMQRLRVGVGLVKLKLLHELDGLHTGFLPAGASPTTP